MRKLLEHQVRRCGLNKLIVLSNRAPFVFKGENMHITKAARAVSGLVSALEPITGACGGTWVGWGGRVAGESRVGGRVAVPLDRPEYTVREMVFSRQEYQRYYHGFANDCLWPLFHCFLEKAVFDHDYWQSYVRVNCKFAEAAAAEADGDALIWVHDYHLTLVPGMLRDMGYRGQIAFFCHIPFPPLEIFSALPWGEDILRGLLGSDLVAFHLNGYVENFLRVVEKQLQAGIDHGRGRIDRGERTVRVRALPIGIDYREFEAAARREEIRRRAAEIRRRVGVDRLVLSVERLDYTKGIIEKLQGIEEFFSSCPQHRNRVAFLQVAVPSRTEVQTYADLRSSAEEMVSRINGLYASNWSTPVKYMFKAFNRDELVAHYCAADVCLVTSLRDGLNLVAKEYVASRVAGDGVLVLSTFAGAAEQLSGCLPVNPYDRVDLAEKINKAVEMAPAEQKLRMATLQQSVRHYDLNWWWQGVLAGLARNTGSPAGAGKGEGPLAAGEFVPKRRPDG
ncbi:MAG: trehalose-6-phosphate synthase [Firmicutes bacterium]|nr:trehalose-6-phosphate synthase [Bacillota bacterium]